MCYSFRGGSSNPGWGSSSQTNPEIAGNCLEVRAILLPEEQQAWEWARGSVERVEGMGPPRVRWLQRALDDRNMDEGERRFYQPLLGKQSTKPLRQSGCTAHASVPSWRRQQIPCPRLGLIGLSLLYENSKSWREVLVWANWKHYIPMCTVYTCFPTCHQHVHFCVVLFLHSAFFYLYLSYIQSLCK